MRLSITHSALYPFCDHNLVYINIETPSLTPSLSNCVDLTATEPVFGDLSTPFGMLHEHLTVGKLTARLNCTYKFLFRNFLF